MNTPAPDGARQKEGRRFLAVATDSCLVPAWRCLSAILKPCVAEIGAFQPALFFENRST
jgi:hypothetical protein